MVAPPPRISTSRRDILFLTLFLIYAAGMVYLCNSMYLWEDEGYTLQTTSTSHSLGKVISTSFYFEGQPPAYFLLLALWRKINSGIFFARLLSVLFIWLGAYFFNKLAKLEVVGRYSPWMIVIFLLNPFAVWSALEIRLYAMLVCLGCMAIYYFFSYLKTDNRKDLYKLLLITFIGLYTQYLFAFLIIALGTYLLCIKGWPAFFKFCLYQIPIIILFIPNLYFIAAQVSMHKPEIGSTSPVSLIYEIVISLQNFFLGLTWAEIGPQKRMVLKLVFGLGVILTFWTIIRNKAERNSDIFKNFNVWLLCVAVNLVLYVAGFLLFGIFYQLKYLAASFPMYLLVFTLFSWLRPRAMNIAFSLLGVAFLIMLVTYYRSPVKTYDFKNAAKYVERVESANERILFFSKGLQPPFVPYYKGHHALLGLPPIIYDQYYYEHDLQDTAEMGILIKDALQTERSFILLTDTIRSFIRPTVLTKGKMDFFLNSHYDTLGDTVITGRSEERDLRIRRMKVRE